MNWISPQILCHMHTDAAEGKDFRETESKQEIMREKTACVPKCVTLDDWLASGDEDQYTSNNLKKQRYGLAFWHAWQPVAWFIKPTECVCVWVFGCPVQQCMCVITWEWEMRRPGVSMHLSVCVSREMSCNWTVLNVSFSSFFHSWSFCGYIIIEPEMQVKTTPKQTNKHNLLHFYLSLKVEKANHDLNQYYETTLNIWSIWPNSLA